MSKTLSEPAIVDEKEFQVLGVKFYSFLPLKCTAYLFFATQFGHFRRERSYSAREVICGRDRFRIRQGHAKNRKVSASERDIARRTLFLKFGN
jgi:hypothetical protein